MAKYTFPKNTLGSKHTAAPQAGVETVPPATPVAPKRNFDATLSSDDHVDWQDSPEAKRLLTGDLSQTVEPHVAVAVTPHKSFHDPYTSLLSRYTTSCEHIVEPGSPKRLASRTALTATPAITPAREARGACEQLDSEELGAILQRLNDPNVLVVGLTQETDGTGDGVLVLVESPASEAQGNIPPVVAPKPDSSFDFSDDSFDDEEVSRLLERKSTPVLVVNALAELSVAPVVPASVDPPTPSHRPETAACASVAPSTAELCDFDLSSGSDDDFNDLCDKYEGAPAPPKPGGAKAESSGVLEGSTPGLLGTAPTTLVGGGDRATAITVDSTSAAVFARDIARTTLPKALGAVSTAASRDPQVENLAKASFSRPDLHRYQIVAVHPKGSPQLLTVRDADKQHTLTICDLWTELDFQPGDILHLIGPDPFVADKTSLLIWNPDILLSATLIGDAMKCQRRATLGVRFSSPGDANIHLVLGCVLHAVFQEGLRAGNSTREYLRSVLEREVITYKLTIFSIGETVEKIVATALEQLPFIQQWIKAYVRETPLATVETGYQQTAPLALSLVLNIEENVTSPVFGLRGNIDVTVEATNGTTLVLPLEIKTGAVTDIAHHAQASLYTLLVRDRYDVPVTDYLLVYTKSKAFMRRTVAKNDLALLVNLRNRISGFLREGMRVLPPVVKQSQCLRCWAAPVCIAHNVLAEGGTGSDSGLLPEEFAAMAALLGRAEYQAFYQHWDELITKEEALANSFRKDLWRLTAAERERNLGKGVGGLRIEHSHTHGTGFSYTLQRLDAFSLQIARHDRVVVSSEGHFAIASGTVTAVTATAITIETSNRLEAVAVKRPEFDRNTNQRFHPALGPVPAPTVTTYRVDKDEMFLGLATARYNLISLFAADGDARRRELLVDYRAPVFGPPLPFTLPENHTFNQDQIRAVKHSLSARDYCLILGMPGTGKTTTIAQIVRSLVANGKTVLLAAYTHSAVDNILMKLKDVGIFRAGHRGRVHPEVHQFLPDGQIESADDFARVYLTPPVVASTCLGLKDLVFSHRKHFDYCIVDEASQVSMPVCLGPLRFCDKFILVGDHYQLPPLVVNPEAAGLAVSLFKTLSERFPESVVDLGYQYRMCDDVMLLSNVLIYNGKLKSGGPEVGKQVLVVRDGVETHFTGFATTDSEGSSRDERRGCALEGDCDPPKEGEQPVGKMLPPRWFPAILEPSNRVLFLDHDNLPARERTVGDKVDNPMEAELIRQLVEGLLLAGVPESSIGVMTLYRAQLKLLSRSLQPHPAIDVLTADQFQGRDKDCIILSLVRSNERQAVGDLLKEWRRVNVAITRAKSKLIILGSRSTLRNLDTIDAFMNLIQSRGWMYHLPPHADRMYRLPTSAIGLQLPGRALARSQLLAKRPVLRNIVEDILGN